MKWTVQRYVLREAVQTWLAVTGVLVAMVTLLLIESARQWAGILARNKVTPTTETPFVMTRMAEEAG